MRRFVVAAIMAAAAQTARAADLPDLTDLPILRGALGGGINRNWDGYYVGGQAGYTAPAMDFSAASSSATNFLLRNSVLQSPVSNWRLFGKTDIQSTSFGGFVGRNYQWDNVVIGLEANYSHMSNKTFSSVSNVMARGIVNPDGEFVPANHVYTHNVTLAGNASMAIHDIMTFRGRAGQAIGDWLPYMFGGVAVARVDDARFVSITGNLTDVFTDTSTTPATITTTVTPMTPLTAGESRKNNFIAGYTAGLGTEVMLGGNLFLRAEWEYIKFSPIKDIKASINTGRLGLGYKF